jgi:hypothetical protein
MIFLVPSTTIVSPTRKTFGLDKRHKRQSWLTRKTFGLDKRHKRQSWLTRKTFDLDKWLEVRSLTRKTHNA